MNKLQWCLKAKNGIELIEPNANLAEAYLKKSESSLASMRVVEDQEWIIAMAYCSMHFSLYAILMKIGVKCEIHSCALECVRQLLSQNYTEEECAFLRKSLQARIDKQYYTDREVAQEQSDEMVGRAPEFLIKSKEIIVTMTEENIKMLRENLKKMMPKKKGKKK